MVINFSGLSEPKNKNINDSPAEAASFDKEFLENLVTRICHDLAGCVSSVNNSIDYLNTPDMKEQAEQLLKDSANENLRKLQLFRIAFGTIKGEGAADLSEFKTICGEVMDRIEIDWNLDENFLLTQENRRIIANSLIALNSISIKDCSVLIAADNIKMRYEKIREDSGLSLALEGKQVDYNPQNIQFYYLHSCSDNIKLTNNENELEISW